MKISKLSKFAGIFFALALGTTSIYAQGYGYGRNGNSINESTGCVEELSGLTDIQISQIEALETSHQEEMDILREKRRSTTDAAEKQAIREEMLEVKENHQSNVESLLNDQQKEEYAQLHANDGQHLYAQNNNSGYGQNSNGLGRYQNNLNINPKNNRNHSGSGFNTQRSNYPGNNRFRNN